MGSNPSSNVGGKTALTTHPPSFDERQSYETKRTFEREEVEEDGLDVEDDLETQGLEKRLTKSDDVDSSVSIRSYYLDSLYSSL